MSFDHRLFGNEQVYVQEVLDTGFSSTGSSVMMTRLEKAFRELFGVQHAISHVNGTATLHAALEAAGIRAGDEVIVPPLTMSSTSFAVLQANATPVFADVDGDSFQIDPASIEEKITERTRAIMTVALYGLSPDMDPIMEIADRHNLFVLEDDAQCLLGRYKGLLVGTIGHAASFSFQSSKHITSGEGGMIITDDGALAESVRKVTSLGYAGVSASKGKIAKQDIQRPDYERHLDMGWNYRMPELCAAVALAQLENAAELVERRIACARLFSEAIDGCTWLVPQKSGVETENVYWTWVVRLDHPRHDWQSVYDEFVSRGGHGFYGAWQLTYLEPAFRNLTLLGRERFISEENRRSYRRGACPVAESLQPCLAQFKTDYWRLEEAEEQARILRDTVGALSG